jgi:transposase-like protein
LLSRTAASRSRRNLWRAVDRRGLMIELRLTARRDIDAARAILR